MSLFAIFQTDGRSQVLPVVQSGHNRMNVYMNTRIEAHTTGQLNASVWSGNTENNNRKTREEGGYV